MTVQGEGPVDEKIDPSQMYNSLAMADERIQQLQTESEHMR